MPLNLIKALDEETRTFGGYLVPFGSPEDLDLDGEFFAPSTKGVREWYDILGALPAVFHHEKSRQFFEQQGLDLPDDLPLEGPIGKVTAWKSDENGHYVEGMLGVVDASRKWYEDMIWKLIQEGKLFFSSGALPQRVKPPRKDGMITEWPVIEASFTPTPANPKHTIVSSVKSVKSAITQIGLDSSKLDSLDEGNGELPTDGKSEKAESVNEYQERVGMAFQAQEAVRSQLTYVVDMLMDKSCVVSSGRDHFKVGYSDDNGQLSFASSDQWIPVKREWVEIPREENKSPDMDDAQKRALALLELIDLANII